MHRVQHDGGFEPGVTSLRPLSRLSPTGATRTDSRLAARHRPLRYRLRHDHERSKGLLVVCLFLFCRCSCYAQIFRAGPPLAFIVILSLRGGRAGGRFRSIWSRTPMKLTPSHDLRRLSVHQNLQIYLRTSSPKRLQFIMSLRNQCLQYAITTFKRQG